MPAKTIALIVGAVVFSVLGQLFLKSGAGHISTLNRGDFLLAAARDSHVVIGIASLAASTICWLYVLRVAPLSRTYGVTSLTYVITPMASVLLFGEQMRRVHVVGTLLIVVGIAFLVSGD
jgi:multidrug transporter EmrE-like cation transporter